MSYIHNEISKLISKTQEDYNKENGVECVQQLLKFLSLTKSEESNKICLKLIKNQGVWKCKDCQKNKESIYCNECWALVRNEHIKEGHKYEYIGDYICGTCDCGNTNNIEEKFICRRHKKNFEENIERDEEKKKKFEIHHKELFSQMANYISEMIIKNEINNDLFKKNIKTFIDYISELSFNSKNLLNWISELLLRNYPISNLDTNHKCIDLENIFIPLKKFSQNRSRKSSESNMMNMIYPESDKCSCPFLRYLISVWPNGKINTLLSFSQNYDLKISIGILYLFLYDKFILKEKNDFSYLTNEFLFSEIRIILSIEEHKYLLNNLLESPPLIITNKIRLLFSPNSNNNIYPNINEFYTSVKKVINNLKFDILNILSNNTQKNFISNDAKFYLYLIDMLAEFHNINSIKGKFNHTQKETNESYNSVLLQIELSLLDIFTTITSIIDFTQENIIKKIFLYFNQKISQKKFKILLKDEYSYHISLFRGFSIFLNRFCFYFASKYDCDIIEGCKYIKENNFMPDYDTCFEYLFEELSKLFRFIAACGEDLFIQCGEKMTLYEKTYYYTYKFVYRDFSLMKYLIPHGSFQEFFSISEDKEDLKTFLYFKDFKEKNPKNIKSLLEEGDNKKYMRFFSRLLTIILNIIRNNGSLIWNLGSSYKALKSCQINDELLEKVINADITNMKELTKTLIINKAIVEENSASFSDLYNGIYYILREIMTEEEFENLIQDMFDSKKTNDQKVNYSIKDDYLNNIDTNYILSPEWKAKAEKYLSDFKKKQISIFNRCFYNVNKYEAKLTEEIYNKIYTIKNEQNLGSIEFIINSIKKLVKDNDYNELRPFFLNTLLNYFDVFLRVNFDNFKKRRNNLKKLIDNFIEEISINNLEEPYKSYCDLIIKIVKEDNMEIENQENKEKNNIKQIKQNLKEKHKLQRKKFLNEMKLNIKEPEIKNLLIQNNSNETICCFCKNNLNEKDLGNCFGKLGYFLLDKFHHNSTLKILKKLYNDHIKKEINITSFNNISDAQKEKAKKNLRIFNCGHIMHFSCYYKNFTKSDKTIINNFICPVCKKNANTFIPKLNHILNEKNLDKNFYSLFKGYNMDFILQFRYEYGNKFGKFLEKEKENNTINLISEEEYKKIKPNINLINEQKNYLIKNYNNVYISCRHLIEGFFSIKANNKTDFNIESEGFNKIQKDTLFHCFLQFRDFTDFFIKCDKKKDQIFLWKNMILSFRLMLKVNILRDNFFVNFNLLLYQMYNLTQMKNISNLIINNQFTNLLSGILFLICIFFEYDDIKGYEKYILYLFLPLFSFSYYFRKLYLDNNLTFIKENILKSKNNEKAFINKMEQSKFTEFLKGTDVFNSLIFILKKITIVNYLLKNEEDVNKDLFDFNKMLDWLNLSQLKQKNILEILSELELMINNEKNILENKMIDINEEPNENIYNLFFNFSNNNNKSIYNHKKIYEFLITEFRKDIKNNKFPKNINPNLLCFCEEIDYKFIKLPEYAVDFLFEKYNCPCEKCKKKGLNGLFCLDCGKKVICLYDVKNLKNEKNNNTDVYLEVFDKHVELCGGGTGALLNIVDFKVIFFQQKKFSNVKIPIYLDKHGESINDKSIHNGFSLNQAQLKNAIKHFYNNDLIFP